MSGVFRNFFFSVLAAAIVLAGCASFAGVCARVASKVLPFSEFTFPSDKTHLIIPLDVNPTPFFNFPILTPKDNLLYRAPGWTPKVVFYLGHYLADKVSLSSAADFRDALEPGYTYTFVLTEKELILGRIPKADRERFSKHLVLANHAGVLMSGDFWFDQFGRLATSNASGSYAPPLWRLKSFVRFLEVQFGIRDLATYGMDATGKYQPVKLEIYE